MADASDVLDDFVHAAEDYVDKVIAEWEACKGPPLALGQTYEGLMSESFRRLLRARVAWREAGKKEESDG